MGSFNRDSGPRNRYRGGFDRSSGSRGGYGRGSRMDRQMYKAVCSNCGKDCEVPFKPTGDKPVYCSDCFEKMGGRADRKPFDKPRFGERRQEGDRYKAQFEAVNSKLDTILNLLQPKPNTNPPSITDAIAKEPIQKTKAKPHKSKASKEKASVE